MLIEDKLDKIQIKVLESITSLNELNDLLIDLNKQFKRDDYIMHLWNKGCNKYQIANKLDMAYSTISYKIDKLIKAGKIQGR